MHCTASCSVHLCPLPSASPQLFSRAESITRKGDKQALQKVRGHIITLRVPKNGRWDTRWGSEGVQVDISAKDVPCESQLTSAAKRHFININYNRRSGYDAKTREFAEDNE